MGHITQYPLLQRNQNLPLPRPPQDKHGLCACVRGKNNRFCPCCHSPHAQGFFRGWNSSMRYVVMCLRKLSDLKIYVCTEILHRGGNSSVRYIVMCITRGVWEHCPPPQGKFWNYNLWDCFWRLLTLDSPPPPLNKKKSCSKSLL